MLYNGKICELVKHSDNCIVLSYTHKAVENVNQGCQLLDMTRYRLIKCVILLIVTSVVLIVTSVLVKTGVWIDKFEGNNISIEEFSIIMVSNKWMVMIYKAFTMFNSKVYLFGDCN